VLQALNKKDGALSAYDVDLATTIGAQVGEVLEQAALREQALDRKRLQAEMDLARSIQQRLLPAASPQAQGLDIAGTNHPATETSGDYYDYVPLSDGRLGVVIADVTGHGLGAALVMTAARAFVRAACGGESDPGKVLAVCNNLLAQDLDAGNFLSLCLAAFDPAARTLQYSSAGHDPPLLYRPSENTFAELESTGPLLGIVPGMDFAVSDELPLQPGDVLLFMTDGLFECMNDAEETFGKERLKDIVRAHAAESASAILTALLAATSAWTGGQPPRDDITVVVVKVIER
jgi:serine phosphatase RsbU (regulator of sigma subunit)